jgi:hypothetical protein
MKSLARRRERALERTNDMTRAGPQSLYSGRGAEHGKRSGGVLVAQASGPDAIPYCLCVLHTRLAAFQGGSLSRIHSIPCMVSNSTFANAGMLRA